RRFVGPVEAYQTKVKNALFSRDLFQLAQALEALTSDPGEKGNNEKPRMEDLWKHPDMKNLASEIREFRDTVLYGDPLVVSKRVGKGRVVAYLTTAGTSPRRGVAGEDMVQWNNWGAGEKVVSMFYPFFLMDLQRYLVAEGQSPNFDLG